MRFLPFYFLLLIPMTTDLTEKQPTALESLPEETKAILRKARGEMYSPTQFQIWPKLRIAQNDTIEGVDEGHFYIEKSEKRPGSDERQKVIRNLGATPHIAVLKVLQRYSYFVQNKPFAYTNEFSGYGPNDYVYLINCRETPYLEAALPFQQFKTYYQSKYLDEDSGRSKLQFKKVIYVMAGGEICEMEVSKSSMVGIPEGEQYPDYGRPQACSFQVFEENIPKSEVDCLFSHWARLSTQHKAGTPSYYYIQFHLGDRLNAEELQQAANQWVALGDRIQASFNAEFQPLIDARDHRTVTVKEVPAPYVEAQLHDAPNPNDVPPPDSEIQEADFTDAY